jgi:hypothetical protein
MLAAVTAAESLPFDRSMTASEVLPPQPSGKSSPDRRDIASGSRISRENYSDQPYVVITKDGSWLRVLTTGKGIEGREGQHIISTISLDKGRTWSQPVDIEPASGPEASWVMPLAVPGGRVYSMAAQRSLP